MNTQVLQRILKLSLHQYLITTTFLQWLVWFIALLAVILLILSNTYLELCLRCPKASIKLLLWGILTFTCSLITNTDHHLKTLYYATVLLPPLLSATLQLLSHIRKKRSLTEKISYRFFFCIGTVISTCVFFYFLSVKP